MEVEALAGTPNWHAARRGLLTASRMADAIAVLKTGKPSESRRKLMFELLAERMTGNAVDHYVTPAMQWGLDNQADAIAAYEAETGELVGPEVFVLHPSIDWLGATPDGLVGSDGLLEIKCPTTPKHLAWVMAGEVPEEHKPQMLCQLACTRRQWVDFVAFDPRVKGPARLFIRRFEPPASEIERIEEGAREFLAELQAMADALEAA
jgi:putative phage-type endonuclease